MGPEVVPLKTITAQLATTPTESLIHILPDLQKALTDSKSFFESSDILIKHKPQGVVLDNFIETLTALLSDSRRVQCRWTALVLIKTTLDISGSLLLQNSGRWIRSILNLLGKWQDPWTTKKLAISALTKLFQLTHTYPNLIREVTTPNLPQFTTVCLQNVKPTDGESQPSLQKTKVRKALQPVVMECFSILVVKHPNIFRTYEKQIREWLLFTLSNTGPSPSTTPKSGTSQSRKVRNAAAKLFVLLHFTAPKNNGATEWNKTIHDCILDAHSTTDRIFRSVHESWRSTTNITSTITGPHAYEGEPAQHTLDQSKLRLSPWTGLHAGTSRLHNLLMLLETFVTSSTIGTINFPLASLTDLLIRLFLTTAPSANEKQARATFNDQTSNEERQLLFSLLPSMHTSALRVVNALYARFDTALTPIALTLFDHIEHTFVHERFSPSLRREAYQTLSNLLAICGPSLQTPRVRLFGSNVVDCACADIIPPTPSATTPTTNGIQNGNSILTPSSPSTNPTSTSPRHKTAALNLLTATLSTIPPAQIPTALRTSIDRTAVLANDKTAMLASVLNAPATTTAKGGKARSSILPFLARSYGREGDVEGLLRPRVPVVVDETKVVDEEDEEISGEADGERRGRLPWERGNREVSRDEHVRGQETPGQGTGVDGGGRSSGLDTINDGPEVDGKTQSDTPRKRSADSPARTEPEKRLRLDSPVRAADVLKPAAPAPVVQIVRPARTGDTTRNEEHVVVTDPTLRAPATRNTDPEAASTADVGGDRRHEPDPLRNDLYNVSPNVVAGEQGADEESDSDGSSMPGLWLGEGDDEVYIPPPGAEGEGSDEDKEDDGADEG